MQPRPVIYQLLVRLFGNTNEQRKPHGTLEENGCGKFSDINEAALMSIREMGFNHLWLTGVLEQASGTAYPGRPADDPSILKGIAGSPYAIKDYFDVCPDYANDPENRLGEFRELLDRCHDHGFQVIIDFVPNHVARSYESDVMPDLSFGKDDRRDVFFDRDNHFYYLQENHPNGPPLRLPNPEHPIFPLEQDYGRVSGNNVVSWRPALHDWYETVKLNYGHDFTQGRHTSLPHEDADLLEVPKTWQTMDRVLRYWQEMGVDGFRVDMAHLVPIEFWRWALKRAKARAVDVFLIAEAYDNDPAKMTDKNIVAALLEAGFDAIYDDPLYDLLEGIYDSGKWANDLDQFLFGRKNRQCLLRYAENHDEVRLANPHEWSGLGMKVGKPVTALSFTIERGPVMIYQGQEVGEPAVESEGFCGDHARTSIFDYWSMPEFVKWVNGKKYDGGKLSAEQKELREWYGKLIHVIQSPAFTQGSFYGLNHANHDNPMFGRIGKETVSGRWLYAFLRHDSVSAETFLVVINFHGSEAMQKVKIEIPDHAWDFISKDKQLGWKLEDRLGSDGSGMVEEGSVKIGLLGCCTALVLKFSG